MEFQAAFSLFDVDGKGEIDFDEFAAGVKRLGLNWRESTCRQCFNEVDEDAGGILEFIEFSYVMSAPSSALQEQLRKEIRRFREAFQLFDLEEDGELTAQDIQVNCTESVQT